MLDDDDPAVWCPRCGEPVDRPPGRGAGGSRTWAAALDPDDGAWTDPEPTGGFDLDALRTASRQVTVGAPPTCPACGTTVPGGGGPCPGCGAPLHPAEPPGPSVAPPTPVARRMAPRWVVYAVAAVIVALVIGAAAYWGLAGDDGTRVIAMEDVNVRSEPRQADGNVRGQLRGGQAVTIECRQRRIWGRVASGELAGGFVSLNFVRLARGDEPVLDAIPTC